MLKFGMKTAHSKGWDILLAFFAVAAGFLIGFWPVSVAGVLLAAVLGRWVSALILGLLLDVVYGVPQGFLHIIYFPVTLFALLAVVARSLVAGRIRIVDRNTL